MLQQKNHELEITPGQEFDVDLFRPEDALGVTNLFITVYGKEYPIKTFIDPDRLIRENKTGRTISSVARTSRGDIVGHNALFQSAPYDRIYESGAGAVHPLYRGGGGIFTRLIVHGMDVGAERFGVEAIYGEAVCNHVFSQKATTRIGAITRAVEVDLMPASAYEKEQSSSGRVSSLLDFVIKKPKHHAVYLPAVYEQSLRLMYEGLEEHRTFSLSDEELPDNLSTEIKTQVFDFAQVARFAVLQVGSDFTTVFDNEEKAAHEKDVAVLQVWVKLSWPWVGQVADELRARGYFMGGVLPRWFDKDGLLMQKIMTRPNWEGMQIHFERAKKIVEMVKADWKETQEKK